jgi:hypothetical protein
LSSRPPEGGRLLCVPLTLGCLHTGTLTVVARAHVIALTLIFAVILVVGIYAMHLQQEQNDRNGISQINTQFCQSQGLDC